jgi:hypothetical protein
MEIVRTGRRNLIVLSAVGLVGVAAMTGIAIAGNVDWGPPGSPSYATYEMVNRLTGLALACLVAAPLALRLALAAWEDAGPSRIAATVVAIALCGMVVGSVLEFWVFTDQPYQGLGSEGRNLAWSTFLLSGMVVLLASTVTGVLMLGRQTGRWSGCGRGRRPRNHRLPRRTLDQRARRTGDVRRVAQVARDRRCLSGESMMVPIEVGRERQPSPPGGSSGGSNVSVTCTTVPPRHLTIGPPEHPCPHASTPHRAASPQRDERPRSKLGEDEPDLGGDSREWRSRRVYQASPMTRSGTADSPESGSGPRLRESSA